MVFDRKFFLRIAESTADSRFWLQILVGFCGLQGPQILTQNLRSMENGKGKKKGGGKKNPR